MSQKPEQSGHGKSHEEPARKKSASYELFRRVGRSLSARQRKLKREKVISSVF